MAAADRAGRSETSTARISMLVWVLPLFTLLLAQTAVKLCSNGQRGGWGHIKAREEAELYAEDHDAAGMRAIPAGENAENAGDDSAQRGGRAEEDNPRFRRERDDEDD